jgi:hypothetical protein
MNCGALKKFGLAVTRKPQRTNVLCRSQLDYDSAPANLHVHSRQLCSIDPLFTRSGISQTQLLDDPSEIKCSAWGPQASAISQHQHHGFNISSSIHNSTKLITIHTYTTTAKQPKIQSPQPPPSIRRPGSRSQAALLQTRTSALRPGDQRCVCSVAVQLVDIDEERSANDYSICGMCR